MGWFEEIFVFVSLSFFPKDLRDALIDLIQRAAVLGVEGHLQTSEQKHAWVKNELLTGALSKDGPLGKAARDFLERHGAGWILDILIKLLVARLEADRKLSS